MVSYCVLCVHYRLLSPLELISMFEPLVATGLEDSSASSPEAGTGPVSFPAPAVSTLLHIGSAQCPCE